jgi:hypothetical protein
MRRHCARWSAPLDIEQRMHDGRFLIAGELWSAIMLDSPVNLSPNSTCYSQ